MTRCEANVWRRTCQPIMRSPALLHARHSGHFVSSFLNMRPSSAQKPFEGGHYGAGFVAHLVVMKCADSIPLHRLAKQYQRLGIPMSRSTITDQFHAAAEKLSPLSQRLIAIVARGDIGQGEETSMMMQRPHKRGFVWTFIADGLIAYRFSSDRSGETPRHVLGGTLGTLVVDAYTGYNRVTDVEGRARASCLAHVRRRFFDA